MLDITAATVASPKCTVTSSPALPVKPHTAAWAGADCKTMCEECAVEKRNGDGGGGGGRHFGGRHGTGRQAATSFPLKGSPRRSFSTCARGATWRTQTAAC